MDSDSEVEEKTEGNRSSLKIDDWVLFKIDSEAAQLVLQLRQKWHSLFLRKMRTPGRPGLPVGIFFFNFTFKGNLKKKKKFCEIRL